MLEKMSIDLAIRRYIDITLHEVGVDEAKLTDTLAEVPFRRFFYYWRQKHTEPIVSQQEVEDMVHAFLSDSWEQYYRHPQQEFEKKMVRTEEGSSFRGCQERSFRAGESRMVGSICPAVRSLCQEIRQQTKGQKIVALS